MAFSQMGFWFQADRLSYITRGSSANGHGGPVPVTDDAAISPDAKPRLPRGVRLTHSEAQGGWVLLAPERVFKADGIAVEIIKRCTGEATFGEIVDDLAKSFNAPRERIETDVGALLRGLADKRLLDL
jgi:pyrroloquinoline quinone biosynthesis protein D